MLLLAVVIIPGLLVGVLLRWTVSVDAGNVAWIVVTLVGVGYSLVTVLVGFVQRRLGVDVIALLALVGALAVKEYFAGAIISVMLATGRALESWAAGQARRELRSLLARVPRTAHRYFEGTITSVDVDSVTPGDLLLVEAGEVMPVDATLASTFAVFDESALSGESLPIEHRRGDRVRSGVVNAGAPVDVRAVATASDSTYAGIVRLVGEAEATTVPFVRLADRYALGFLFLTLATAGLAWWIGGSDRAVAVLVVATPCPLLLAVPVALVAGLSRCARRGIIVKGGAVLEQLAKCSTLLMDKTGTITKGHPALAEIVCAGDVTADEILRLAASLDQVSPHVLASAVTQAALDREFELTLPSSVEEIAGSGIRGQVGVFAVSVGKASWCGVTEPSGWARSARRKARLDGALTVFVGINGLPAGVLVFNDPLRPEVVRTMRELRHRGITRIVMVTGDRIEVAETVSAIIGVDEVLAERSPEEKLDVVRRETKAARTMMVGDGINDAPALALASVGVAMGARGATAASEAADVVITADRLDRLSEVIATARRTMRIAVQSMLVGMSLSIAAMVFAAAGLLPVVGGALLQEAIDVAAILNALRALRGSHENVGLGEADATLARRFQVEHLSVRVAIERVRHVADSLDALDARQAWREVRGIHETLIDVIEPHERAEESELYPALERFLGGSEPLSTMSRGHVEIAHQIRRLGQLLDEIDPSGMDQEDRMELRRLLYGLYAILKLHTAQEDESYLSLEDGSGSKAQTTTTL